MGLLTKRFIRSSRLAQPTVRQTRPARRVARLIEIRVGIMCFLHGGNERRNDKKRIGKLTRGYLKNMKRFQVASWLIHAWSLVMRRDFGSGIKGLVGAATVFLLQTAVEQPQLGLLQI